MECNGGRRSCIMVASVLINGIALSEVILIGVLFFARLLFRLFRFLQLLLLLLQLLLQCLGRHLLNLLLQRLLRTLQLKLQLRAVGFATSPAQCEVVLLRDLLQTLLENADVALIEANGMRLLASKRPMGSLSEFAQSAVSHFLIFSSGHHVRLLLILAH